MGECKVHNFWELASRVSWNKSALCDQYFLRLPLCLLTEILRGGKPTTLAALRLKAQDADNIYWMQEDEAHSSKNSENIGHLLAQDFTQTPSNSLSTSTPNLSHTSSTTSLSTLSSDSDHPHRNNFDQNGKLTGSERDRRMKEGLCLYCGKKGHFARDCSKLAVKTQPTNFSGPESASDSTDSEE